jgi:N6-adenosine-specific RNA methylase IME4
MKKFEVIYADPAWKYSNGGTRAAAVKNYATMTLEQICALPVPQLAADNCALFLWITSPLLLSHPSAVFKSWGFEYKTVAFAWAKRNKKQNTPFFGMGNWSRANVELCLIATRGEPKRKHADVKQFCWQKIGRHSEKPAEIRDRIVRLMGDVPRVEMFARHEIPGWDRWICNDVAPTVTTPALAL